MVLLTWTTVELITVLISVLTILYLYIQWTYQYWNKRNVPQLEPSFPWGNFPSPFSREKPIGVVVKDFYAICKEKNWKHLGLYGLGSKTYIVKDLEYVKNIMTKDFQYFVDRDFYYNEKDDPLSAHLFAIGGVKWRNLRTKMTPTFTSGKMRMMFQTLVDCEEYLQQAVDEKYQNKEPLDIKEMLACFTTDIIGSCAFGLEFKSFKEENSSFRRYGRKVFETNIWTLLKIIFSSNFTRMARFLGVRALDKDVTEFFTNVVKETVEYREKNNYTRKDFMQLLIDIKNNKLTAENGHKNDGTTLTIEELAAQSFIFFLAGFETSSTTMTFALYELAQNQEIQQKVRKEINEVLAKYDGKITYDAIMDMKYMNQVVEETLRKYPPLPFVTRSCVKDYKVPDDDVIIEKGTKVIIPIMGIHYDDDYYTNPEKFDPERFNEANKKNRNPYAHIPFGEGPRICIGLRFGMMQSKVGLTSLLRDYKFTLSPKTKQPMKLKATSFILTVDGDVWLDAEKVKA